MEKEKYIFNLNPLNYQTTGYCDFSKIYNPKSAILTYTDINNKIIEQHILERTENIDENGIKNYIYLSIKK